MGKAFIDHTGLDQPGYRRMSLANAAVLDDALRHRHTGGSRSIERIARDMGVSRRTLYRWRGARFHDVTVAGWTATFVTRPHHDRDMPVQVTPWREVEP